MKTKSYIVKVLKNIGRSIELFVAFLFFYLIVTIYGAVIPTGELKKEGELCIFVQSNGIHTDVCLPTQSEDVNWTEFISTKDYSDTISHDFITIGWGDKGFFLDTPTWAELKVSTALNAAFLPSSTAMHVKYHSEPEVNETRKKVFLNRKEYQRMIKYIKSTFKKKGDKVDLIKGRGYTNADNFYEANDSYHMFRTCNRWTNEALKAANIKTGVYALFPDGILSHL